MHVKIDRQAKGALLYLAFRFLGGIFHVMDNVVAYPVSARTVRR